MLEGVKVATPQMEKDFHRRLRNYRLHGEWFELPEPVVWNVLGWFGRP